MFTEVAATEVLAGVRAYDFGDDPAHLGGGNRVDAIVALDRLVAAAQAEQLTQIVDLHAERVAVMGLGRGDPTLSVIGEIAMARNIGPTAACTHVMAALVLRRLPAVGALFDDGVISLSVVRAVVDESTELRVEDYVILDGEIAPILVGMTTVQARQATARAVGSAPPATSAPVARFPLLAELVGGPPLPDPGRAGHRAGLRRRCRCGGPARDGRAHVRGPGR